MFDLLIAGGRIYDGRGGAPFRADVGIRQDRIAAIGNLDSCETAERFDASGMAVTPGWIDEHTHSDWQLIRKPDRKEALCQGITTEIVGACGIGLFPLKDSDYAPVMAGIYGSCPDVYGSCSEYLDALPETGTNAAVHLAHSPLRCALCGFRDEKLPVKKAQELARRAFEEGACALSTGLAYYPASFSDTEEVAELCRIAAEFDAPICVHQRTALRENHPLPFDSREEVLEFARRSGVRVHFSHYRTNPRTAGNLEGLLEVIERGVSEGLRVSADFYPYPVGAGYAAVHLPMRVMEGGFRRIIERLDDPVWRRWILDVWQRHPEQGPSSGVVLHAPRHPEYLGRSYREIAEIRKESIPEMVLNLLKEEALELAFRPEAEIPEETGERLDRDFVELMRHPAFLFGSDTLPGHAFPHPRSRGAFARLLKLAVRNELPLSEFVRSASARPCELFGLRGRGVLAEKNFADLCVFRPEEVVDRATFADPFREAAGMRLVLVNGKIAVKDGRATGVLAGRAIRRGK